LCYIEGGASEFRATESKKPKRHEGEERKRRKKWQRLLSFLYVRDLLLLLLLHRKSNVNLLQNFFGCLHLKMETQDIKITLHLKIIAICN